MCAYGIKVGRDVLPLLQKRGATGAMDGALELEAPINSCA
jgi:hypothetical protein